MAMDSNDIPISFLETETKCIQFIECFTDASTLVSGTYYPTLSIAVPIYILCDIVQDDN